jgi:hypothetical protein
MKKAEIILKKAALFERLSLYGNRNNFLKALAQDIPPLPKDDNPKLNFALKHLAVYEELLNEEKDPKYRKIYEKELEKYNQMVEMYGGVSLASHNRNNFLKALAQDPTQWTPQLKQLLDYAKQAINQMDPTLKSKYINDAKMAAVLIENASNIDDIGNAIPYMKKVIPWMQGPNNFEKAYTQLKNSMTLPQVQETPAMPAGGITPTRTAPQQTDRSLFDFYYKKLIDATNKPSLTDLFAYIPKMEELLQKMDQGASSVETKTLIGKGRQALTAARLKAGLGESSYIPPEENPEFNVSETW